VKPISLDLRERILAADDADEGSRETVARRFRVSLGMVSEPTACWRTLSQKKQSRLPRAKVLVD
jgi:hypothetical protein